MKTALYTLAAILLVAVLVLTARANVVTWYVIPSEGMTPTLLQGDRVLVFKQQKKEIVPGSIAVFRNPANTQTENIDDREAFIAYCAATPGGRIGIDTLFNLRPDSKEMLTIPCSGQYVEVTPQNMTLLRNTLVQHEQRNATIENGGLLIDGKPVRYCQFQKNYYWMSNNGSIDSRTVGLVPADHLIGKARMIWFSKDEEQGITSGWRWNRVLKRIATP